MVESVVEWVSEWVEEEHDAINNTKKPDDMEDENYRDASWYFLCWWRLDGITCVEPMQKTKNMIELVSCPQKRMGIKFLQKYAIGSEGWSRYHHHHPPPPLPFQSGEPYIKQIRSISVTKKKSRLIKGTFKLWIYTMSCL